MCLRVIEMRKHKTIAVDFDGTLSFGRWTKVDELNTEFINF